jgi:hypothetical protein
MLKKAIIAGGIAAAGIGLLALPAGAHGSDKTIGLVNGPIVQNVLNDMCIAPWQWNGPIEALGGQKYVACAAHTKQPGDAPFSHILGH